MNNEHATLTMGLEALDHQLSLLDDLDRLRSNIGLESLGDGLEGIGGAVKKVWDFILKMLAGIRDAITNLFRSKAARAERQKKDIDKAAAEAQQKSDGGTQELSANPDAMTQRAKAILAKSKGDPLDGLKTVEEISKDLNREAADAVNNFHANMAKLKINADNTVTIEGEFSKVDTGVTPAQQKAKDLFTHDGTNGTPMTSLEVSTTASQINKVCMRVSSMAMDKTFRKDVDTDKLVGAIRQLESLAQKLRNAQTEDDYSLQNVRHALRQAQSAMNMAYEADRFRERSIEAYINYLYSLRSARLAERRNRRYTGNESIDLDYGNWGSLF